jgi:signal peptidase II
VPICDPRTALRSPRAWSVMLLTLLLGLFIDLASKSWTFANVADEPVVLDRAVLLADPEHDPVPRGATRIVVPHLLQLRLAINLGAVFGIAANQQVFFIGFTGLAVAGGLLVFTRLMSPGCRTGHLALGMVFAGGIGNLHDRVRFGAVRDFLHMMPGRELPFAWTWPGDNPELCPWVFNVADLMLLIGMIVLMKHLGRRRRALQELEIAGVVVSRDAASG